MRQSSGEQMLAILKQIEDRFSRCSLRTVISSSYRRALDPLVEQCQYLRIAQHSNIRH